MLSTGILVHSQRTRIGLEKWPTLLHSCGRRGCHLLGNDDNCHFLLSLIKMMPQELCPGVSARCQQLHSTLGHSNTRHRGSQGGGGCAGLQQQEKGPRAESIIDESASPKRTFHSAEFSLAFGRSVSASKDSLPLLVSVLNRLLTSIPPTPKHPRRYFSREKNTKQKHFNLRLLDRCPCQGWRMVPTNLFFLHKHFRSYFPTGKKKKTKYNLRPKHILDSSVTNTNLVPYLFWDIGFKQRVILWGHFLLWSLVLPSAGAIENLRTSMNSFYAACFFPVSKNLSPQN